MTIAIYIAAPQGEAPRARRVAEALRLAGHRVVSSWHAGSGEICEASLTPEGRAAAWATNAIDLSQADVLVALTSENAGRETYCEIGRAIARRTRIVRSLERGGQCLSLSTPAVAVGGARRDADVPAMSVRGGDNG